MKQKKIIFVMMVFYLLSTISGCASTDRVVFVTSTELDIGYDATIGNANIGYDRNELVIGPVYPETGGVPPIVGSMYSNLSIFNPKVRQFYATGDAARVATNSQCEESSSDADCGVKNNSSDNLTGKRRIMFFGTNTNIGLKVKYSTTGPAPSSVSFGFKRQEYSMIPLIEKDDYGDGKNKTDRYGAVMANIDFDSNVNQDQNSNKESKLEQFIATGQSAVNLAKGQKLGVTINTNSNAGNNIINGIDAELSSKKTNQDN